MKCKGLFSGVEKSTNVKQYIMSSDWQLASFLYHAKSFFSEAELHCSLYLVEFLTYYMLKSGMFNHVCIAYF